MNDERTIDCPDSLILDFGLARITDDDPGLTATGLLAGTPNFMSPEQARGLELDGRSDLFSLGCVMYRLLTGRLPFGSATVLATLQAIQTEQPAVPQAVRPDVSEDLADLTMCLLEKQPANRPSDSEQLVTMLSVPRDQWPVNVTRALPGDVVKQHQLSSVSTFPNSTGSFNAGRWIVSTRQTLRYR